VIGPLQNKIQRGWDAASAFASCEHVVAYALGSDRPGSDLRDAVAAPVHVTDVRSLNPCIVEHALYLDNTFQKKLIPQPSSLALSTANLCVH
jgi:hypothetical protein